MAESRAKPVLRGEETSEETQEGETKISSIEARERERVETQAMQGVPGRSELELVLGKEWR